MVINLLSLFSINVLFTNYFFQLFAERENAIIYRGLENIAEDLARIQFPIDFNISLLFISIIVSIFTTFLITFMVYKSADINKLETIINSLLKLFFVNLVSISSVLYFLRIYNAPRGLLLINIISFPFLFGFIIYFLKYFDFVKIINKKILSIVFSILSIFIVIYIVNSNIEDNLYVETNSNLPEADQINIDTTQTTLLEEKDLIGDYVCYKWSGSDNYQECIKGTQVKILDNFGESLNNIVHFNDDIYFLNVDGIIYKNTSKEIFLDLSEKILSRIIIGRGANGLFGLAFHPNDKYFIVSYSDLNNNYILEKFELSENGLPNLKSNEKLIKVPNGSLYHFAGSLLWSDYFNDFIVNIGDMDAAQNPIIKSEALYTNSPRGKILLLENFISNPVIIGEDKDHPVRKNILGFGLRNPWQTYEYGNLLFIPDIGNTVQEELNIVNLNDFADRDYKPFLFGWPYYEGVTINKYRYTEVSVWQDNQKVDSTEYITENSIQPVVFYNHDSPDTYRAALIGGVVIQDESSEYFEHYFFAEYFAKEIYSYDYKNNLLYHYPLPQDFDSFITSVTINKEKKDSLLVSIGNGNLAEISLPEE